MMRSGYMRAAYVQAMFGAQVRLFELARDGLYVSCRAPTQRRRKADGSSATDAQRTRARVAPSASSTVPAAPSHTSIDERWVEADWKAVKDAQRSMRSAGCRLFIIFSKMAPLTASSCASALGPGASAPRPVSFAQEDAARCAGGAGG